MIWLILLLSLIPSCAWASYSQIQWDWTQGSGGAVVSYTVKCGHSSGNYTFTNSVTAPTQAIDVYVATGGEKGQFFCTVTAVNGAGESSAANEITFLLTIPPLDRPFGPFGEDLCECSRSFVYS